MSIFRSQEIDLYQILIPKDYDWDIINELASLNSLHFIDLNKGEQPHHLRYFPQVKRAEEAESVISDLEEICRENRVPLRSPQSVDGFLQQVRQYTEQQGKAPHMIFSDIEHDLQEKVTFWYKQQSGLEKMKDGFKTMVAKINILKQCQKIFQQESEGEVLQSLSDIGSPQLERRRSLTQSLLADHTKLIYIGGLINKKELMSFKKLLFRATRGKSYTQVFNIESDPDDLTSDKEITKNYFVYLIMFEEGSYIRSQIQKICSNTQEYSFEIKKKDIGKTLFDLKTQKAETTKLISETKKQLVEYLFSINKMSGSEFSLIEIYKWFILMEKSIHIELNKLKDNQNILTGLFWCPTQMKQVLEEKLNDIRLRRNIEGPQIHQIPKFNEQNFQRPTFIESNDFTWPFQEIVNTYGIPAYKEVNPALFTIVTFPFLFGVMFGDVLHGSILFFFASYLCFAKAKPGTALGELFKIRYLLLLMGTFSLYCGFIYNDFTSIPLYLFGKSCYSNDFQQHTSEPTKDCVYPVGVDPSWFLGKNELTYMNSLKMKISVILGVGQMCMGICLKAFNAVYFKRSIDFFFEFLPQITLLLCLFGFMDFLIIAKWLTDYSTIENARPPSIITQMIVMCLRLGESDPNNLETPLIDNQSFVMKMLLFVAIICVPLMLFVKPIREYSMLQEHAKREMVVEDENGEDRQYVAINDEPLGKDQIDENVSNTLNNPLEKEKKPHNFGDMFIHQLIETIEFVLGTVSNTASYLRLWALSLAHSQLAKVFLENTLVGGIRSYSYIQLLIGFFVYLAFTVGVLMMMDLMEAFLHTLRLHWVEFQNKFYKGNGQKFSPFSIESVLKQSQMTEPKKKPKKDVYE